MGIKLSKVRVSDNYDLREDKITVNFIQIKKNPNSNVTPEQLNVLFGLNIPKYSKLGDDEFPYLFCVHMTIDIQNIIKEYRYVIGSNVTYRVDKNKFNSQHKTNINYFANDYGRYELVKI